MEERQSDLREDNQPRNDNENELGQSKTSSRKKQLVLPDEGEELNVVGKLPEKSGARHGSVVDGRDNVFYKTPPKFILSLNQDGQQTPGHFLRVKSATDDGKEVYSVASDGTMDSKEAAWLLHFTELDNGQRIVILENVAYSTSQSKWVLCAKEIDNGQHILAVKNVERIPERLRSTHASIMFYQKPRSVGSSWVYFESSLESRDKTLLVGFDSKGEALPLEKVRIHSRDFEAYFRIF